jgi:hypothetical protein
VPPESIDPISVILGRQPLGGAALRADVIPVSFELKVAVVFPGEVIAVEFFVVPYSTPAKMYAQQLVKHKDIFTPFGWIAPPLLDRFKSYV